MKTHDKIAITVAALLLFISHAIFPVGKMLGYEMPFFSVIIGMLGTLGVIILFGIYFIWKL